MRKRILIPILLGYLPAGLMGQILGPTLGFDPTEFVPIVVMGQVPNALLVNAEFPAKSVPELIAAAKASPGKITAGTQGIGTTSHLTSEMFQMLAKVTFQQVPYRGSAPALTDLMAGSVDLMFDNLGVTLSLVRGGQLKLLGVASAKPVATLAGVPTIAQTLPGFESVTWFGLVAPPKTPKEIAVKINRDVNEALRQQDVLARLAQLSAEPVGGTVEETAAYMRAEVERWGAIIKSAHVKLE